MKNKLFPVLFALPITTGICGALLRALQLRNSYDPAAGILEGGDPSGYGFSAVCIIAFLMALIAAFISKRDAGMRTKGCNKATEFSLFVSSGILLVYAGMVFFSLQAGFDTTKLVLALFSVYCAVSLLVFAKYSLSERDSTAYCVFSAVPSFWACFMLILAFREKTSEPIISLYLPLILSYVSILLFCYALAAHLLGKDKRHVAVFSCFFGIFFILVDLLSLLFAGEYLPFGTEKISELLPELAFLVLMPSVTAHILKK